jgi:hypothetical protein
MALLKHWNSKLRIPLFTLLTFLAGIGFTLLIHNYESENRKSLDREHADRHMYIDKQRHKEKLAQPDRSDNIIKLTS